MKIELKNVKIAESLSEETIAFTASLWIDGRRVGRASNRGHGDPNRLEFDDREVERQFNDYVNKLPPVESEYGPLDMCPDLFISELVVDVQHRQWLKRQTRNKIIFRLEGDDRGAYRTIPKTAKPSKAEAFIRQKYGDQIIELHS